MSRMRSFISQSHHPAFCRSSKARIDDSNTIPCIKGIVVGSSLSVRSSISIESTPSSVIPQCPLTSLSAKIVTPSTTVCTELMILLASDGIISLTDTTKLSVVLSPASNEAIVPSDAPLTNVVFSGTIPVNTIFEASTSPVLATVIVYSI